jgi:hypothetical protein
MQASSGAEDDPNREGRFDMGAAMTPQPLRHSNGRSDGRSIHEPPNSQFLDFPRGSRSLLTLHARGLTPALR